MSRRFDAIVIGAGQAGTPLAGRLSDAGMSVALVERHLLGGTCVNTGCKPTKTLVASAYAAHMARRAADFGVTIGGEVGIDFAKVRARADKISADSRASLRSWIDGMAHCTLFFGHATFEAPHRVRVGDEVLEANRIFLNVGGRALVPDMPGVEEVPFLTNSTILKLDAVPRHLVVVGGSYIGLEFGQMFRRFGAEVTIVEKGPRLIGREDPEISDAVRDILEAEGIAIRTGAECIRFAAQGQDVLVGVDCHEGSPEVLGSHVLLAVGRTPNTDDLGLDAAGVATDTRGYVQVDDRLRTNVAHIWAMGDCNGRGAFTHTAYNDFEIVAENLLDGADRKVTDRIPAYALYIDPPLGRVGMGEAEAKKSGHRIEVGKRPMTRVGRAVEKAESLGFMKLVTDADSGRILGGAILGTSGDEAIHGVLDLMVKQGTATDLAHAVHIHPTVSELLPTIAGERKPA
ncbi:FAD-containing oxidoreductase [Sphingomonas sp. ABOLD]|uniref:Pyruvate/2-oxoglutarate dehydrogenase complex dihydrolipoamide dehydrogenase (E3) component n=1 Tax=Sphingomonas trueperi TaxID=53317 RepID=A0A7X5Y0H9_9SPHN|nr:FAD-containing oxidoreductase [Sphingomonas sp. ABOLD]NJB98365.1 pyruvate/2-oxoglutarate dehydrogenase complex dihydrolipoamide dehydrogenase (E3) component [Sphingomonas trueperi]RSV40740.1 FAD-containing oxidoreductase [Sphingomonas sp. ABOLD]